MRTFHSCIHTGKPRSRNTQELHWNIAPKLGITKHCSVEPLEKFEWNEMKLIKKVITSFSPLFQNKTLNTEQNMYKQKYLVCVDASCVHLKELKQHSSCALLYLASVLVVLVSLESVIEATYSLLQPRQCHLVTEQLAGSFVFPKVNDHFFHFWVVQN